MAIITFWSCDKKQTGETLATVAVATKMAIERNVKILLVSTSYNELTIQNCYMKENEVLKKQKMDINNLNVETGIEGLTRLIASNKIEPSIITDYSKVILKNRLDVLTGFSAVEEEEKQTNLQRYHEMCKSYPALLKIANQYYDMVLVDLDRRIDPQVRNEILELSNLDIYVTNQRMINANNYIGLKERNTWLTGLKNMVVIGNYDDQSKYNKKNLGKYLDEKGELSVIPYNTLFFEAAEEATTMDLFLKLSNIKDNTDKNYIFMKEINKLIEKIFNRLQELQIRMG